MKIESLTATAVALPLATPTTIATRALSERQYLLVTVTDNDGAVGTGYAYIGVTGARTARMAVEELLAPLYVGADADAVEALWRAAYQDTLLSGRRGVVLRALSAVDIAVWDLKAKRFDAPLSAVLGGPRTGSLPAYASGGYYRPGDLVENVREEIAGNRASGFTDHKIKVGGASVAVDAKRVAAAMEAVGEHGRLALDANNAYRSVAEAEAAGRAFIAAAGRELWWFEEPLTPDDLEGHLQLADKLPVAIATGEIHQSRWEVAPLLHSRGLAYIQIDAGVIGGVTEWMRVARAAEVAGVPVAPHWHHNLHVHLGAAVPGLLAIEHFDLAKDIYNFERLLTEESRLEFGDGAVFIPERNGIGIAFDTDAVSRYTISS